jgi:AraC family transcriptional regulator, regulatory protein of adaptative response / DNA-3-methyladenine glycosylase II
VVEAVVRPAGLYRLRLITRGGDWRAPVRGDGTEAAAWQRNDGAVVISAPDEEAVERARFMLALDDDTTEFHRRFARDPLLGATARTWIGWRPLRLATVTHAALRAVAGQLIESRRARAIERAVLRACGQPVATQESLRALSPAHLCRCDLAPSRAATLARLCRTVDLERLRDHSTERVAARLGRERGVGPWSIGVIALEGLGRYDAGLVGDLGLVKLMSALRGRWVETWETAELLAPYGEWQGLAGELLLLGWARGLVPGADPDIARRTRLRSKRAA